MRHAYSATKSSSLTFILRKAFYPFRVGKDFAIFINLAGDLLIRLLSLVGHRT